MSLRKENRSSWLELVSGLGGAVVVELDGQARARHGGPPQEPGVRGCGFYLAHNGMPLKGWKREFDRIFK